MYMKRFTQLLFIFYAMFLAYACNNQEEIKEDVPKIEIAPESESIVSQGILFESGIKSQSQIVRFNATASWSADVAEVRSSAWLSVEPTSGGSGSVSMNVVAQPNTELSDREASITIKCGTDIKTIRVKQSGVPLVNVESIELNVSELFLVEGESATLTAAVKPSNVTDPTVTWTSSDEMIVNVVDGNVTAIEEGIATITASAGEMSTTCNIIVSRGPAPEGNIVFVDPVAKAVCVQNWDTDGDGELSFKEAASVESFGMVLFGNKDLVSFDEFQYFTGVNELTWKNFSNCLNLRSITIPKYVKSIEETSFSWCTSLQRINITENRHYTSLDGVLYNKDLTELICYPPKKEGKSYEVPESVSIIDDMAFLSCSLLESIILHDSIISMDGSFGNCTALKSIRIPQGVTRIGEFTFSGCTSLVDVVFHGNLESIEPNAFEFCSSLREVILPNGIRRIGKEAFVGCSSLISVLLPDSVELLDKDAFKNCSSLTSISLPRGLKTLEAFTFSGCSSLEHLDLPNGLISIGGGAFQSCTKLKSIRIPNSVTSIGSQVFWGCSSLADISIPDSVTDIGISAFRECSSLSSVALSRNITVLPLDLFLGCVSLKKVVIPEKVQVIGESAFYKCSSLTSISLPKGLTSIGQKAFGGCSSLASITIPEGVTCIADYLFWNCTRLKSVILQEGITSIGSHAFGLCSIEDITIPKTITRIGDCAFDVGENASIKVFPETPPAGDLMMFNCLYDYFTIYVPSSSVDAYKSAPYWRDYAERIRALR